MVLLRGVQIGNFYKILGSIVSDGCNIFIVPDYGEKKKKLLQPLEKRLCYGIKY